MISASNARAPAARSTTLPTRAVAFRLGMPFYVFNFADEFREKVIGEFLSEYERGRTPNPCITCNRCLKFERFLRRARELECEKNGDRPLRPH